MNQNQNGREIENLVFGLLMFVFAIAFAICCAGADPCPQGMELNPDYGKPGAETCVRCGR